MRDQGFIPRSETAAKILYAESFAPWCERAHVCGKVASPECWTRLHHRPQGDRAEGSISPLPSSGCRAIAARGDTCHFQCLARADAGAQHQAHRITAGHQLVGAMVVGHHTFHPAAARRFQAIPRGHRVDQLREFLVVSASALTEDAGAVAGCGKCVTCKDDRAFDAGLQEVRTSQYRAACPCGHRLQDSRRRQVVGKLRVAVCVARVALDLLVERVELHTPPCHVVRIGRIKTGRIQRAECGHLHMPDMGPHVLLVRCQVATGEGPEDVGDRRSG